MDWAVYKMIRFLFYSSIFSTGIYKVFPSLKVCNQKIIFRFLTGILLAIFVSGLASAEYFVVPAEGALSPLEQFLQYREQYGVSTARLDMEDDRMINNSILVIGHAGPTSEELSNFEKNENLISSLLTSQILTDSENLFLYHWEQDSTFSGSEYSSYINEPVKVTFLDENILIPDNSASLKLQQEYGIVLSNEKIEWNHEHSYAILEMMKIIPHSDLSLSKWILTSQHIDDDIRITKSDSQKIVEISLDAFENANPKLAIIDDKRGKYFSQKLHHALVWFVTDEGRDKDAIEKILKERYGISTKVSDFSKLTQLTTREPAQRFQEFHSWELIEIINMFEEMPSGFHSIEGLNYLVRRADGVPHPLYPQAPAVSWSSVNPGYIEFMESAFTAEDGYLHRLIIHEKSHFMWNKIFSNQIKEDWINLGGWNENVRNSSWSTSKTTEFVSAYAHSKNPDEDMAESIAYFVLDPDKLKSRSLQKFEFIRDRIMQGDIYLSVIREDLTFDVYNMYPDYIYPGKIIRVDISIKGEKNKDKLAKIEIELNAKNKFEGAKEASLRLFSDIGTYQDVNLYPVEGSSDSILQGEITLSKYAKNGFWNTNQIVITDQNKNQRFSGPNDFGWKFFVNNSGEDLISPEYVEKSLTLTKRIDTTTYQDRIQIVTASWDVKENKAMKNCHAKIKHLDLESYSIGEWGKYNSTYKRCEVDFKITDHFRSGVYGVRAIMTVDQAGNKATVDFTEFKINNSIAIFTNEPDTVPPYLALNAISVSANSLNPQEPNGETKVNIVFHAKDDKSGIGTVSYILRDPQGIEHFDYHYHDNFHSLFFIGNPNEMKSYEIDLVLPVGSPPGKWGLTQITLEDKANNKKSFEFTETIHFELD